MPYRPTDRTRARLAAARETILQAAEAQLAEGGYGSASVAAVARRAGVATATVHRHFPSKGDLFAEVFGRAADAEVEALRAAAGRSEPAVHRLAAWVEAFVRRTLAAPVRARALLAEPVSAAVEAQRAVVRRAYAGVFAEALREGAAHGGVAPVDPDLAAAAIVGALAEALVGPLAVAEADADELVDGLQRFVLSAVTSGS
jgi:AcrR family transcriptional regulator